MIKFLLTKLRHALRELPDDIVYLNTSLDNMQVHIDKMKADPHGGASADFNIRYIHIISDRLRRAELDGKLMFDIPEKKEAEEIAHIEHDDKTHPHTYDSCHDADGNLIRPSPDDPWKDQKGFRTYDGREITPSVHDVLQEWSDSVNKRHNMSVSRIDTAHSHLEAAASPTVAPYRQRINLVEAAVQIILQIEHRDSKNDSS